MRITSSKLVTMVCLASSLALLWACDGFTFSFSFVVPKFAEATDTQSYALPAGAGLIVNNDNGSTHVTVDPAAAQATVEVRRVAVGSDQAEADDLLSSIIVTITEPTAEDNNLRINAPRPAEASDDTSDFEFTLDDDELTVTGILSARKVAVVHLEITLPSGHPATLTQKNGSIRATGLDLPGTLTTDNGSIRVLDATAAVTVNTDNGNVFVEDHRAGLDAEIDNGSLEMDVDILPADQQIIARVDHGEIDIELPRDIDAQLSADVDSGMVRFDLTDFDTVANATGNFRSINATLNGGGPPIDLEVEAGRIDIDGH